MITELLSYFGLDWVATGNPYLDTIPFIIGSMIIMYVLSWSFSILYRLLQAFFLGGVRDWS